MKYEFPDESGMAVPAIAIGPDDLACVSFTSGSTGKPKGVLGKHGALSHFNPWLVETFELKETDRFSVFSSLSHDPLQRDIFTPLMYGASVFFPPAEEWRMPGRAVEWMQTNRISVSNLTPSLALILSHDRA